MIPSDYTPRPRLRRLRMVVSLEGPLHEVHQRLTLPTRALMLRLSCNLSTPVWIGLSERGWRRIARMAVVSARAHVHSSLGVEL